MTCHTYKLTLTAGEDYTCAVLTAGFFPKAVDRALVLKICVLSWESAMKSACFVCLFAILISGFALAQSNPAPRANQTNKLHIPQAPYPGLPNPSQMPTVPFAQRGTGTLRAGLPRRRAAALPGLSFANAVAYGSGGYYASAVAVADVNGDGKLDLLVANWCATGDIGCKSTAGVVAVLLGNGDGTFQTAVTYGSGGYTATSVAVADVNGDGKPDLIVANECADSNCNNGSVGVLLGNGDGTFQTAVTYGSGGYSATSVAAGDFTGNGKPDLVVANACTTKTCSYYYGTDLGILGVLLNDGDGTFQTAVAYTWGNDTLSVAVADVNGDGKPDLIATWLCVIYDPGVCYPGGVGVLLGNGDGTFQPGGGATGYFTSVTVADVNGDGKPDLVVICGVYGFPCGSGNNTMGVLLGNGDGTFQSMVTYDSGGFSYSAAVADVNGDGNVDLLVANSSSNDVGVLLGNGDGTFQTATTFGSGGSGDVSVAAADVNGDGRPDVLLANSCADSSCNNGSVGVLLNTSLTPTTTTLTSSPNPSKYGQLVTLTATVTAGKGFYKGTPTGTVSFYNGTTNIGNANLNGSGVAVLKTSKLPPGTDSLTATYNGDSKFASSTSSVVYQVVKGSLAAFSPASLDFGNQTVDIASSPRVVTLTNIGNLDMSIRSIRIAGTDGGDFSQDNNCPKSLAPNDNCKIRVAFTPTTTGKRVADLEVTDNAPYSPQKVPLSGVGVLPAVTFSPTKLTFPVQLVFTESKPQTVMLTNSGLGILLISKITVTGQFKETNDCRAQLKHDEKCTISVKFDPQTSGVQKGSINVTDNASGSPQQVPLTGICTYIELIPTKVNFGTQPVGTKSLPKKVTVTNKGDAAVNITGIAIAGADAGDFAQTNNCGSQLASGHSCFIKVTFKPLEKGERKADVSISDDGGGSPQSVSLAGTGT